VEAGQFRSDLFFRVEVFPIELPPLRERASDIAPLAAHLLEQIALRLRQPTRQLSEDAKELLRSQAWPGNVRQLANVLERAVIVSEGSQLTAAELQPLLVGRAGVDERQRVREALLATGGDKRKAAGLLDLSYRTLLRRIKEHDLEGFPKYRD
jgi:DNA-binding NtrC family response regulator